MEPCSLCLSCSYRGISKLKLSMKEDWFNFSSYSNRVSTVHFLENFFAAVFAYHKRPALQCLFLRLYLLCYKVRPRLVFWTKWCSPTNENLTKTQRNMSFLPEIVEKLRIWSEGMKAAGWLQSREFRWVDWIWLDIATCIWMYSRNVYVEFKDLWILKFCRSILAALFVTSWHQCCCYSYAIY